MLQFKRTLIKWKANENHTKYSSASANTELQAWAQPLRLLRHVSHAFQMAIPAPPMQSKLIN